jgi:hypothetical protein
VLLAIVGKTMIADASTTMNLPLATLFRQLKFLITIIFKYFFLLIYFQLNLGTSANMAHPFHMHGTKFYVMKTGMMRDNYQLNGDLECAHKGVSGIHYIFIRTFCDFSF